MLVTQLPKDTILTGTQVKEYRKLCDLTRKEFGAYLGYSESGIQGIEERGDQEVMKVFSIALRMASADIAMKLHRKELIFDDVRDDLLTVAKLLEAH